MSGIMARDGAEPRAPEKVADIVAEMRRIYPPGPLCEKTVDGQFVHDEMRWLADRIEAAAKREELRWAKANGELARLLGCEKAQGGNATKLREALERIAARAAIGGEFDAHAYLDEIRVIAESALSAPPRNCDRFATAAEAVAAHKQAEQNCPPADCPECPYIVGRKSGVYCFEAWLFAPAAQEGGDHA